MTEQNLVKSVNEAIANKPSKVKSEPVRGTASEPTDVTKLSHKNNPLHVKKQEKTNIKLKKQNDENKKSEVKKKVFYPFVLMYKFVKAIFSPNTYVKLIQSFEDLLLVVFVDSLMLFILVSLAYIIYSLMTFGFDSMFNMELIVILLVKIVGCTLVSVICIWAQSHIPVGNNPTEKTEEVEE